MDQKGVPLSINHLISKSVRKMPFVVSGDIWYFSQITYIRRKKNNYFVSLNFMIVGQKGVQNVDYFGISKKKKFESYNL